MENLNNEGIRKLFAINRNQRLVCKKSDWTMGITESKKYELELTNEEYITFTNDNNEKLSIKINTALKHFITIVESRSKKLVNLKNILENED